MDLLKRGDYEGTLGYLLWVSDFIPNIESVAHVWA